LGPNGARYCPARAPLLEHIRQLNTKMDSRKATTLFLIGAWLTVCAWVVVSYVAFQ